MTKISLPPVVLAPTDLSELQERIDEMLEQPDMTVTVSREGIETEYPSLSAMLDDGFTSGVVRNFELVLHSPNGRARVVANSRDTDAHSLFLKGEYEWRQEVRGLMTDFMNNREKPIRGWAKGYPMTVVALISSLIAGEAYVTISPLGIIYPAGSMTLKLQLLILIFAPIFFASAYRRKFFPYACWCLNSGKSTIYRDGLIKVAILSLVVLSSLLYISTFLDLFDYLIELIL